MGTFDDRSHVLAGLVADAPASMPALLDPRCTLQDVLDSLTGQLDAVQRQAFRAKMAQLDEARDNSRPRVRRFRRRTGRIEATGSRAVCWLN